MLQTFIERPVLSTVISILLVILGILGLVTLPVTSYPDIAPPSVRVSTFYAGASAEVVASSVIAPIQEQINGVEGMTYMTSMAGNDGTANITVFFELGTNVDIAAVNVQNRVSQATSSLPSSVIQYGVTTAKQQNSMLMFFTLYDETGAYDETFLQNYANINLVPEIQRISGVGQVNVFGVRKYAMRIWLNPDKLTAFGLTPADVSQAINAQNLEAAPGAFGKDTEQAFAYTIRYKGTLKEVEEYENIVVRANQQGILRLKDVARVELGAFNYGVSAKSMGGPGVAAAVYQTAGSNAQQINQDIVATLEEASKRFPPGVKYNIPLNTNDFLDASISQVQHTLFEAFVLVVIVVLLFLQDLRSTIIPAIAVPVAIIGTFFFMEMLGFSLNLLTLFALVLAIGIVVDDAIVVVEAVHAKMEQEHIGPKQATTEAMSEIRGAIISITLVMSAVFVPVSFMTGSAGVFYRQFALTLAISIIISAVNALTLSPALCAVFLRPHKEGEEKKGPVQRFYAAFNAGFDALTARYMKVLDVFAHRKIIVPIIVLAATVLFAWLLKTTPAGFIPTEDQGIIFGNVTLPPGATQERTQQVLNEIDAIAKSMPVIVERTTVAGVSIMSGANDGAYGLCVFKLKPWDERKGKEGNIQYVLQEFYRRTAHITAAQVLFFMPPTVPGFGNVDGFEVQLQDRTGGDIVSFMQVTRQFLGELMANPAIEYAVTTFNPSYPQYMIEVDEAQCAKKGLTTAAVLQAMQAYYGGQSVSTFNRFGKQFYVTVQADNMYRATPQSVSQVYVRNSGGEMVPLSAVATFQPTYGPPYINNFNMFTSITVTGKPKAGYSTGDAIAAVEAVGQNMPLGYSYAWSGMTREELQSSGQAPIIFALCLIFVYFLLAAQYESYILPFSVIFTLPVGLSGCLVFINIFGMPNDIYVQIAMIMLIGLLAKNAILIVEFAVQRRHHGLSIVEAALEGAHARLRPILMTSLAFTFGLVPLVLTSGAGAAGNHSISISAIGGMIFGTFLGVFVTPTLFIIFQSLNEKLSSMLEYEKQADTTGTPPSAPQPPSAH